MAFPLKPAKNCSNDDIFISCDDRIGKMLLNICMSAVALSLRWANRGPWASCLKFRIQIYPQQIVYKLAGNNIYIRNLAPNEANGPSCQGMQF